MSALNPTPSPDTLERIYLASEDLEPRSPNEAAAARALARYREALQTGKPLAVEDLVRQAPHAEKEIRDAVEAYNFIVEAGSQPGVAGVTGPVRAGAAPELFPVIPSYQVIRVIGQGGMGVIYAAVQESLQRPVAIKVLSPRLDRNPDVIARFTREIKLLTRLTHPNIVDIIDAGVAGGRHYYVMEYVDGLSLERIIRKHRVRHHTAVAILKQIVSGLAAAHRQGILHRDLKPGNILLDRNGVVRIADFGLAAIAPEFREADYSATQVEGRLGTVGYMSPEQLRDPRCCDERSDIYAVGVIFYQMLTGHLPHGSFTPASELCPGATRAIDRLIDHCLRTDPDDRFPSCDALLRSIGRLERRINRTRKKLMRLTRMARAPAVDAPADESETGLSNDPDLMLVLEAWPHLSDALRAGIVAIARTGLNKD